MDFAPLTFSLLWSLPCPCSAIHPSFQTPLPDLPFLFQVYYQKQMLAVMLDETSSFGELCAAAGEGLGLSEAIAQGNVRVYTMDTENDMSGELVGDVRIPGLHGVRTCARVYARACAWLCIAFFGTAI